MYIKEQNLEIEKVCRVFVDYIKKIHILMWSGQTNWDMSIWTAFLLIRMTFAWRPLYFGQEEIYVRRLFII